MRIWPIFSGDLSSLKLPSSLLVVIMYELALSTHRFDCPAIHLCGIFIALPRGCMLSTKQGFQGTNKIVSVLYLSHFAGDNVLFFGAGDCFFKNMIRWLPIVLLSHALKTARCSVVRSWHLPELRGKGMKVIKRPSP